MSSQTKKPETVFCRHFTILHTLAIVTNRHDDTTNNTSESTSNTKWYQTSEIAAIIDHHFSHFFLITADVGLVELTSSIDLIVDLAPGVVLTIDDLPFIFDAIIVVPPTESKSAPILVSAILAVVLTAASLPMAATTDFGDASFFDF